ncbi:alpha/beta hydrolase [Robertmurraya kyonggiensis]|uniref:Alpha/beta hydrolase n=1 Tax=Robertmurraya kyonggiensis TaxID=1037680 RepID=A0A4U1D0C4_9BACI|nr:alpha/beta hydrolase [Robertmurraya kyonggiensis]TKC15745.1 alpha/beta hydrolase [Robertmurraya kyonggiensis]
MNVQFDFSVNEKTYGVIGERNLKLYIFQPVTQKKDRTAILFFNGGSFNKGKYTAAQFQHQANYFSSIGIVSICVDYRNANDEEFSPIQAISDAKTAVRWVRQNSNDLGVDPEKIVMCAASSGGYTAVSSIMFENINNENDDIYISNIPNALVIFAAGMNGLDITERLFPELKAMAHQISPMHNIKKCLPPTIWFCGTADIAFEQNKKFCNEMVKVGNTCMFIPYEGMEHGFFNYGLHQNIPYNDTNQQIEIFLRSLGFVNRSI